jgi:hypothetical protein
MIRSAVILVFLIANHSVWAASSRWGVVFSSADHNAIKVSKVNSALKCLRYGKSTSLGWYDVKGSTGAALTSLANVVIACQKGIADDPQGI